MSPKTSRFAGARLDHIAFPLGGLGAGMVCLEGSGALGKISVRNRPDLLTDRKVFAALTLRGPQPRAYVLEGPVPTWKLRPQFGGGVGWPAWTWGLPRFRHATFEARFPFAAVSLTDERVPVQVELMAWSPFEPGDPDNASLPVAGLEYRFTNSAPAPIDAVFSFNAENFMATNANAFGADNSSSARVLATRGGFVLAQPAGNRPADEGYFAAWTDEADVAVNHAWFRGRPPAPMQMLWNDIASGNYRARAADATKASPGASLFVPFTLAAGESRTIRLQLAWYVPSSELFQPSFRYSGGKVEPVERSEQTYRPWYAGRFKSIDELKSYWTNEYSPLRQASDRFSRTLSDSTLPPEIMDAVTANLSILKSPTVLRQIDGRLWGWEGCSETEGSFYGTANHVWNYAQALAHLFPSLERTLRETELGPNLGRDGFQAIRSALPIRPIGDAREDAFGFPSAADGQLGTILRSFREWRISGDTQWLRDLWPSIQSSLDYCIREWDPHERGAIEEPHINTYDIEFWGADSLCTSLYAGALRAAVLMGTAVGVNVERYRALHTKARALLETTLFNGEYFVQRAQWNNLRTTFPPQEGPLADTLRMHPEMLELANEEGPPFQYGTGCLSDGVLGAWLSWACGVGEILDPSKVTSHVVAVHRHNFRKTLVDHAEHGRSFFACGEEGGLLVCSWPHGSRPSVPLLIADEVWTGIEYAVASHLVALGHTAEGIEIVRACRRRYDGSVRNPFGEVEAGHWYARALSSYALLQAFSGARFDAVEKVLYLRPSIKGDFRCFLAAGTGYGMVGVRDGQPFVEVASGAIPYERIDYSAG
jgi:uncharacterized protein (DUF608 family)